MTIEQYVRNDLIPLQRRDKVSYALGLMDESKLSHLPVLDGDIFLGVLSEEVLGKAADDDLSIEAARLVPAPVFIGRDRGLFEALRVFAESGFSLLPVLGSEGLYEGYIGLAQMGRELSYLVNADQIGGVVLLEVPASEYSLSEVVQIVESNGLKVLSVLTRSMPDTTGLEVCLKLNRTDLARMLQTFARYEYTVKAAIYDDPHDLRLNDRYESLMRYLDF